MQRRIFLALSLFVFLAFLVMWFTGAHIIKKRTIKALQLQSGGNFQVTYEDVKVSGFPFKWTLTFRNPSVNIVSSSNIITLSSSIMRVHTDISMRTMEAVIDKHLTLKLDNQKEYAYVNDVETNKAISVVLKFKTPFIFLEDEGINYLPLRANSIKTNIDSLNLLNNNKILMRLENLLLKWKHEKDNIYRLVTDITSAYNSNDPAIGALNRIGSKIRADFYITASNHLEQDKPLYKISKVELKDTHLLLNNQTKLNTEGIVGLEQEEFKGRLKVSIVNYPYFAKIIQLYHEWIPETLTDAIQDNCAEQRDLHPNLNDDLEDESDIGNLYECKKVEDLNALESIEYNAPKIYFDLIIDNNKFIIEETQKSFLPRSENN